MNLATEEITSDTITNFVNCVKDMKLDKMGTNDTNETKPDPDPTPDKKRPRNAFVFTNNNPPPVPPPRSKSFEDVVAKPVVRILDTFNDLVVGLKNEVDYRVERRKQIDKRSDDDRRKCENLRKQQANENFFGVIKCVVEPITYTPNSLVQTFKDASLNPQLFNRGPVNVLQPDAFNNRVEQLLTHAQFILSEKRVDPYTRMAGEFHIRNIRTLKDNLMTRMNPAHPAPVNAADAVPANDLDRDTLITYSAEISFINEQADGLEQFIKNLA